MARKADVVLAANKKWRTEQNLIGERLSPTQKAELIAYQEKCWQEAQNNSFPAAPTVGPTLKPTGDFPCTADVATLGTTTKVRAVLRQVETGKFSDVGKPITVMRRQNESHVLVLGLLTAEQAHTLGTQEWKSMGNKTGQYTCKVAGRRFVLNQEGYTELCKLQS